MAVPAFGFSVGDFITGIKLVKDLINALNDTVGAKPAYQRLIAELRNLERALTEVQALNLSACQLSQKIALEETASQCQRSIKEFLDKHVKFKATLGTQPPRQGTAESWSSKLKLRLHKAQWALCREADVEKFRVQTAGHTLTVNMLLSSIQVAATSSQTEVLKDTQAETRQIGQEVSQTNAAVQQNNGLLTNQADLILTLSRTVATHAQTEDMRSTMASAMNTNMDVYNMVLGMQRMLSQNLPPQVLRQQPVYFEDALGRVSPVHVEFINSAEAFQAVLEVRFRNVPGLEEVQKGEYFLRNKSVGIPLSQRNPWESLFLPGRTIIMSMVFVSMSIFESLCPECRKDDPTRRPCVLMGAFKWQVE